MVSHDKFRGMVWGAQLGDALGTKIEFLDRNRIYSKYKTPEEYLKTFIQGAKPTTSDESFFLSASLENFSNPHRKSYTEFLAEFSEQGDENLRKRGVSHKMRQLFLRYRSFPHEKNNYLDNGGMGFLPLILPIVPEMEYDLLEKDYISKSHADANKDWTKIYLSLLQKILHSTSRIDLSVILREDPKNKTLEQAILGKFESRTISGNSSQIIPASITLYQLSNGDISTMVEKAFEEIEEADYDTLFFTTGALIGASLGESRLPAKLLTKVKGLAETEKNLNHFLNRARKNRIYEQRILKGEQKNV